MVFPGTPSALSASSSFLRFPSFRENGKAKRSRFLWNHFRFLSLPGKISAASACSAVDICSSSEGTENFIISLSIKSSTVEVAKIKTDKGSRANPNGLAGSFDLGGS
jgi:hypothetical protein